MINNKILALFLVFYSFSIYSQIDDRGYPFVQNFSAKDYSANSQNFQVTQDNRGVLYFANFAGVIEFDGINWRNIPTENGYRVTSINTDKYGKVFVGGFGEFGYLEVNENGKMIFKKLIENKSTKSDSSKIVYNTKNTKETILLGLITDTTELKEKIPLEIKNVLIDKNNTVFFVTEKGIISFQDNQVDIYYAANIGKRERKIVSSQILNNNLYISHNDNSVLKINNKDKKNIVIDKNATDFYTISFMIQVDDEILIGSGKSGFYILKNDTIHNADFPSEKFFFENEILCAAKLSNENIAIGTQRAGIVIINKNGEIVQIIDKEAGLYNESVSSLFVSNENILWATLYNGISKIQIPSEFSYFNENNGLLGEINDIVRFEDKIYVATTNGLYFLEDNLFSQFYNIDFPCNNFQIFDNKLFVASGNGIFYIKNNSKIDIMSEVLALSIFNTAKDTFFTCIEDKLLKCNIIGTKAKILDTILNDYEIWKMISDKQKNIWLQSSSNGIIKIFNNNEIDIYDTTKGLPTMYANELNIINEEIFIGSEKGIYKYDNKNNNFIKSNLFESDINLSNFLYGIYGKVNINNLLYESDWISDLKLDKFGNIWHNKGDKKGIAIYEKKSNSYQKNDTAFLPLSEFVAKRIFCDLETGNTWFGGDEGVIRCDLKIKSNYSNSFNTLLRKVKLKDETILFEGAFLDSTDCQSLIQKPEDIKKINYSQNTVSFEFSASTYNINDKIKFQYYLEGFENQWSEWTTENIKEYTNLPEGKYTFFVKAQNIYNITGNLATYEFEILTPPYRTWWAITIYLLIVSALVFIIFRWRLRIIKKEKENLEEIVKERTEEIENQKEELQAQSEELSLKNDELERINLIVQAINSEIDFESLLKSFLQKLISMTKMDRAAALIYDKNSEKYKFKSTIGVDSNKLYNLELDFEKANLRYLKGAKEVYNGIYYQSYSKNEKINDTIEEIDKSKSRLTILVEINNKIEGFLIISSTKKSDAFDESDFSLARNLREHINSAFIKAQILENLQNTLTHLKETQDELIRKEKLASVGQLTKGIVDRLINPMNYINNFSEISKELSDEIAEIVDEQKGIEIEVVDDIKDVLGMLNTNLEKINNHGVSATRIVKGMEKLLKEKIIDFKDVDVNELFDSAVNKALYEFQNEIKEFDIKIEKIIEENLETVRVDVTEMNDALRYLINNACYAVYQKTIQNKNFEGKIEISAKKDDKSYIISIKDNGEGIVQSELEHLFEPFFTTKPTSKGTGLGLYMVQDIIKIHKGEISVKSEKDKFTEFTIKLPL